LRCRELVYGCGAVPKLNGFADTMPLPPNGGQQSSSPRRTAEHFSGARCEMPNRGWHTVGRQLMAVTGKICRTYIAFPPRPDQLMPERQREL
jgi:hypothetical protein